MLMKRYSSQDIFPITEKVKNVPKLVNGFKAIELSDENLGKLRADFSTSHIATHWPCIGLILVDRDSAIGILSVNRDNGFIQALVVSEKYRNKGIGSSLLKIARENFHSTHLTVNKKNTPAIKLYGREGWVIYATSPAMFFMAYGEEVGDTFVHDGGLYDLDKLLSIVNTIEVQEFRIDRLKWVLDHDSPDDRRLTTANLDEPILIVNWRGRLATVDGLHRVKKAVDLGMKYIKGRLVPQIVLDQAAL